MTYVIAILSIALVAECVWWVLDRVHSMGYEAGREDERMITQDETTTEHTDG